MGERGVHFYLLFYILFSAETLLKDSVDYKRQIRILDEEKLQLKTKLYYMNLEIQKKDKQMEEIIKASKVREGGRGRERGGIVLLIFIISLSTGYKCWFQIGQRDNGETFLSSKTQDFFIP